MLRFKLSNNIIKSVAAAGLLGLASCGQADHQAGNDNDQGQAIEVKVATPLQAAGNTINVSGQIEASQTANISTRVMGYITRINVKIGDHVSRGQLLATISDQDIIAKKAQADAMITQAETAFKNAQKDKERFTNLYNQQSATAKEVDNINMQYSAAKAQLENARQMRNEVNATLGYTNLTAPFDGTVTQKMADAGSMASPGMPILTVEHSGGYQVNASVPESAISHISAGMPAQVTISAANKVIQAKIAQISTSAQYTGGQYIIKINIPDGEKAGVYAGMYADVAITVAAQTNTGAGADQVLVPMASIEHKDDLTGLYTIGSNHTALLHWVRLGKIEGDKVEVLSGLAKNDQYIVSANGRLYNGVPVKIK